MLKPNTKRLLAQTNRTKIHPLSWKGDTRPDFKKANAAIKRKRKALANEIKAVRKSGTVEPANVRLGKIYGKWKLS